MTYLFPLFLSSMLGYIFTAVILKNSSLKAKGFITISLSAPIGFVLCSLIIFWAHVIYAKEYSLITFLIFYLLLGALLYFLFKPSEKNAMGSSGLFSFPNLKDKIKLFFKSLFRIRTLLKYILIIFSIGIFIYSLFYFLKIFTSISVLNAHGGWDAKLFWNLKAKFYLRSPEDWLRMFSPIISWTHTDYPLMLPGTVAWGWNMAGKEILVWPNLVAFLFAISNVFILIWHISTRNTLWAALIGASFLLMMEPYVYWAVKLYADVPLSFFFTCSSIILIHALKNKDCRLFGLSGFLAGAAAWTKNEGLLFSFFLSMIFLSIILKINSSSKEKKECILFFAVGLLIPLSAVIFQKLAFAPHGDYLGSGKNFLQNITALFLNPQKTLKILQSFWGYMFASPGWNYLWWFFSGAIIYRLFFKKESTGYLAGFISAILVLLMLLSYFVIFHISPHPVSFQVQTSHTRLILHTSILAIIFTFETFLLFTKKKSRLE